MLSGIKKIGFDLARRSFLPPASWIPQQLRLFSVLHCSLIARNEEEVDEKTLKQRVYQRLYKRTYWNANPEYRKRQQELRKIIRHKDHHSRDYNWLKAWLIAHPWARGLTWESHVPIVYPERTQHYCTGCKLERHSGARLWWRRRTDPDRYDCHGCFTRRWPIKPIGYEDVMPGSKRIIKPRPVSEELIKERLASSNLSEGDENAP